MLAANPEALALFHGLADWPPPRGNTARYTFLHPAARDLFADWPHAAATTAANLRAVAAASPQTPGLAELADELTTHSPEFARLWQRYDIRRRRGEPKTFRHPQVGTITLTYEVLQLSDGREYRSTRTRPAAPTRTRSSSPRCWPPNSLLARPGPADRNRAPLPGSQTRAATGRQSPVLATAHNRTIRAQIHHIPPPCTSPVYHPIRVPCPSVTSRSSHSPWRWPTNREGTATTQTKSQHTDPVAGAGRGTAMDSGTTIPAPASLTCMPSRRLAGRTAGWK